MLEYMKALECPACKKPLSLGKQENNWQLGCVECSGSYILSHTDLDVVGRHFLKKGVDLLSKKEPEKG